MFKWLHNTINRNFDFIFKSTYIFLIIILLITILNFIFTFSLYPTLNQTLNSIGKDLESNITKHLPEEYFEEENDTEKKRIILKLALDEISPFKEDIKDFFCK